MKKIIINIFIICICFVFGGCYIDNSNECTSLTIYDGSQENSVEIFDKRLINSINNLVPKGWKLEKDKGIVRGELNSDGVDDLAFVVVKNDSKGINSRNLVLAFGINNNEFKLSKIVKDILLLNSEVGGHKASLDSISIVDESLEISYCGGKDYRWYENYKFIYKDNNYILVKSIIGNYNTSTFYDKNVHENKLTVDTLTGEYNEQIVNEKGKVILYKGKRKVSSEITIDEFKTTEKPDLIKFSNDLKDNSIILKNKQEPFIYKTSKDLQNLDEWQCKKIHVANINERIVDLLYNYENYCDNDYSKGIFVYDRSISNGWYSIIINDRFKDDVVNGIKIGSDINEAVNILGKPLIEENTWFGHKCYYYKTDKYYFALYGDNKIEYIIFANIHKGLIKEEDFMKTLILDVKENNDVRSSFNMFDYCSGIMGGGTYYHSYSGITVNTFDGINIDVYNNFAGNLYDYTDEYKNLNINFINTDINFKNLESNLSFYDTVNKKFKDEKYLSPNKKHSFVYIWHTSMNNYFCIRTEDYSKKCDIVDIPAFEYEWYDNENILYTCSCDNVQYLLNINTYENTVFERK